MGAPYGRQVQLGVLGNYNLDATILVLLCILQLEEHIQMATVVTFG